MTEVKDDKLGPCIITGAEGESAEDCTTHKHERTEWTTDQLLEDFHVVGFGGYCVCVVRRKSDNALGSLIFGGRENPRIYREFTVCES